MKRIFLVAPLLLLSISLFLYLYVSYIFPLIPLWIGGGRPEVMRLMIKPEARTSLEGAGFKINAQGLTGIIRVVQETDNSLSIIGNRTIQIDKATSTVYPFSFTLNRDQILATVNKPVDWSEARYENDLCWIDVPPANICK